MGCREFGRSAWTRRGGLSAARRGRTSQNQGRGSGLSPRRRPETAAAGGFQLHAAPGLDAQGELARELLGTARTRLEQPCTAGEAPVEMVAQFAPVSPGQKGMAAA